MTNAYQILQWILETFKGNPVPVRRPPQGMSNEESLLYQIYALLAQGASSSPTSSAEYSYRGLYDETQGGMYTGEYPTTGGSGTAGAIKLGDNWVLKGTDSSQGTLGTIAVYDGYKVIALKDNPDPFTDTDWHLEAGLDVAFGAFQYISNLRNDLTTPSSDTYPSTQAVVNALNNVASKVVSCTRSDLQTYLSSNQIIRGAFYNITDPIEGGSVLIEGIAVNEVSEYGIWIAPDIYDQYAFFRLSGSSGSVNSVTVGGVNIMTAVVNYTTSLANTASLVATNINANTGVSGYSAVAIQDTVVVYSSAAFVSAPTFAVATTTLVANNAPANMITGMRLNANTLIEVSYDVQRSSGVISSAYNAARNTRVSYAYIGTPLAFNPITSFPWNSARNVVVENGYIRNFFGIQSASFSGIDGVYLGKGATIENHLSHGSTNAIVNVVLEGANAKMLNNYAYGSNSLFTNIYSRAQISGNMSYGTTNTFGDMVLLGSVTNTGIYNNTLSNTSCNIRYVYQVQGATGANGNILSGNLLSANNASVNNIYMMARLGTCNTNTLSGNTASLTDIYYTGNGCACGGNTISGSGTAVNISNINLRGNGASCSTNTVSATSTGGCIAYINLNGRSSVLTGCTVSGALASSTGITNVTINGASSGFTTVSFGAIASSAIDNVIIDAPSAVFNAITFDATLNNIKNVHWTATNEIHYNIIKTGLSGAANNGASGSDIRLAYIPVAKAYIVSAVVEANGLVGAGASLAAGIETDAATGLFPATAITSFTAPLTIFNPGAAIGVGTFNGAALPAKTAAANRRLIATPSVANITAGSLQVVIKIGISNF